MILIKLYIILKNLLYQYLYQIFKKLILILQIFILVISNNNKNLFYN